MFRKVIKFVLALLLIFLVIAISVSYYFIKSAAPAYSGKIKVEGLQNEAEIIFDDFGIPHIFAKSEKDAYFSLGYVIASERLFQLELIKRLAGGRLAEILGEDLLESDQFFRTLGFNKYAEWSASTFENEADSQLKTTVQAYIDGINFFIKTGATPLEFKLIGIEKEPFSLKDIYLIISYMALGFAEGMKTDPMIEAMYTKTDSLHMADLAMEWPAEHQTIPVNKNAEKLLGISASIAKIIDNLPVSPWIGSNSWVLSGKKTKNGKVIFCNDTHMGLSLPTVWYEAHLSYGETNLYGNYIVGLPFALVGHTDFCATGLTMFENDDLDFYYEKIEKDQVFYKGNWEEIKFRKELIKVKNKSDVIFSVSEAKRGPLMNNANADFRKIKNPISLQWTYLQFPSKAIEATYSLNHAKTLNDAYLGASLIHAPGLNVMYGDKDGNIAWWASAKLVKRPKHVNSMRFLDGASGLDEPLGFENFTENPQILNPESNFIYSANNQPATYGESFYPGYYVPENRAKQINKLLNDSSSFTVDMMKTMMLDDISESYAKLLQLKLSNLSHQNKEKHGNIIAHIKDWDGNHSKKESAALFFNHWYWNTIKLAMHDELGDTLFKQFANTHFMKVSFPELLQNENSIWWDNINTEKIERRVDIINHSFELTVKTLENKFGANPNSWNWEKAHHLNLVHPMGMVKPLHLLFNRGPYPTSGGNEVINNLGFHLNDEIDYSVKFGPSMRRVIDFSNTTASWSVLPGGQSGHVGSKYYDDQIKLYVNGVFRNQFSNEDTIRTKFRKVLILQTK